MRSTSLAWFLTSLALLLAGCAGDDEPLAAFGDSCVDSSECAEGSCIGSRCTINCVTNDECTAINASLGCGVGPNEERTCINGCPGPPSGYVCVGDVPVHCSQTTTPYCECGCGSTTLCDSASNTCVPRRAVGEACADDAECQSDNCSAIQHVCRVAIGASCTAEDCDYCLTRSGVGTHCSRDCTGTGTDACDGDPCVGYGQVGPYYCSASCSPSNTASCPGECDITSDLSTYYCRCDAPDCVETFAQAPVGSWCRYGSMCESGECWSARDDYYHYDYNIAGYCTQPCASDADCPEETACVQVDCNQVGGCQPRCVPRCAGWCSDVGTCAAMPNVSGGGSTDVCNVKLSNGAYCFEDLDCQSGNCNEFSLCE